MSNTNKLEIRHGSSADISGAVTNFPLLVRLGDENYNFKEREERTEVIFVLLKINNGVPLPFENPNDGMQRN
jgi:hypothetical protein